MLENGLKVYDIKSKVEGFSEGRSFEELLTKWPDNFIGHFVAYLDYKVIIGKYESGKFTTYLGEALSPDKKTLESKFIQKLRLFDESRELLLWRKEEGLFVGRLRTDGETENNTEKTSVVEAKQVLYGTKSEKAKDSDTFTKIYEDRGTEIFLPFSDVYVDIKENPENRVSICTRNYIAYNEFGQAGYDDCRFVEFIYQGGSKNGQKTGHRS